MMGTKEIPNRADLVDFNYAVAGQYVDPQPPMIDAS